MSRPWRRQLQGARDRVRRQCSSSQRWHERARQWSSSSSARSTSRSCSAALFRRSRARQPGRQLVCRLLHQAVLRLVCSQQARLEGQVSALQCCLKLQRSSRGRCSKSQQRRRSRHGLMGMQEARVHTRQAASGSMRGRRPLHSASAGPPSRRALTLPLLPPRHPLQSRKALQPRRGPPLRLPQRQREHRRKHQLRRALLHRRCLLRRNSNRSSSNGNSNHNSRYRSSKHSSNGNRNHNSRCRSSKHSSSSGPPSQTVGHRLPEAGARGMVGAEGGDAPGLLRPGCQVQVACRCPDVKLQIHCTESTGQVASNPWTKL